MSKGKGLYPVRSGAEGFILQIALPSFERWRGPNWPIISLVLIREFTTDS